MKQKMTFFALGRKCGPAPGVVGSAEARSAMRAERARKPKPFAVALSISRRVGGAECRTTPGQDGRCLSALITMSPARM